MTELAVRDPLGPAGQLSAGDARSLTDEVKRDAQALWGKLLRLYDGGAHVALGYPSWHAYCAAEFGIGRSRSYQLLDAGRVFDAVDSTMVDSTVANERQARELARLHRDEGDEAVLEVVDELRAAHGPEAVTAQRIRRLVTARARRDERERETERVRAVRLAGEERLRDVIRLGDGMELHHQDFRQLDLEPASVDLIFTDPPYTAEFASADGWAALGAFAARVLRPGRLLVAYPGNIHLREALEGLGQHLEFVITGGVFMPGGHVLLHGIKVWAQTKPLVFFSAGPRRPRVLFSNAWWVPKAEKDRHVWQQEVGCARYYIRTLTEPGELVVDPFVGSGTSAVPCVELARRFIGCDIDAQAVEKARRRLEAARAEAAA